MPTFMILSNYTNQGINSIQDSPERLKKFKEIAQSENVKVISHHFLMGGYDAVTLLDAPNAEIVAKLCLIVGKKGNIRTQTFHAFSENEMSNIIAKLS